MSEFRELIGKLETIVQPKLDEAKGHLDHPEDLVFIEECCDAAFGEVHLNLKITIHNSIARAGALVACCC
jgi:hypothetical protein